MRIRHLAAVVVAAILLSLAGAAGAAFAGVPTATIDVANTTLRSGSNSTVMISFSEPVSGLTSADFTAAGATLNDPFTFDEGNNWIAQLTPFPGVTDSSNTIVLDLAGVTSVESSQPGVGSATSNNYSIDTVAPTLLITADTSTLRAGETATITFTFSEAPSGFTAADIDAVNGSLGSFAATANPLVYTGGFTPNAGVGNGNGQVFVAGSTYTDDFGNPGSAASSPAITIDTVAPTVAVTLSSYALTTEAVTVSFVFSETPVGFSLAGASAANGALSLLSPTANPLVYTALLTPTAGVTDQTNVVTLTTGGYFDFAGNSGLGAVSINYTVNSVVPTATVVVADNSLTVGETTTVTITFSEAVTSLTIGALTASNATLTNLVTSDNIIYTATLTPGAATTAATNAVVLTGGVATNGSNTVAATTSNNYAIDTVRPTATVLLSDTELIAGETAVVTITFSEAVTSFGLNDLTAGTADLSNLTTTDNVTFTATLTPTANLLTTGNSVTLYLTGVQDALGNPGLGTAASTSYWVNTVQATLMITVVDDELREGETSIVRFDFSRPVLGFSNANLTVAKGTLSTVTTTDGGLTFRAILTPTPGLIASSNMITADLTGVTDEFGNPPQSLLYGSNLYSISTVAPAALAATGIEPIGTLLLALLLLLLGLGAARSRTR